MIIQYNTVYASKIVQSTTEYTNYYMYVPLSPFNGGKGWDDEV